MHTQATESGSLSVKHRQRVFFYLIIAVFVAVVAGRIYLFIYFSDASQIFPRKADFARSLADRLNDTFAVRKTTPTLSSAQTKSPW